MYNRENRMFTWKAYYYFDGLPLTVYSSDEIEWKDLPSHGVINLTIIIDGEYEHKLNGGNYYWITGSIYGCSYTEGPTTYEFTTEHKFLGEFEPELTENFIKNGIIVSDDIIESIGSN